MGILLHFCSAGIVRIFHETLYDEKNDKASEIYGREEERAVGCRL